MDDDYKASAGTTGVLKVDGGAVAGKFEDFYDEDWFSIYLSSGKTYQITMQGTGSVPVSASASDHPFTLAVLDRNFYNTPLAGPSSATSTTNGNLPVIAFTPSSSGTYFVAAATARRVGGYTLSVASAPQDDYSDDPYHPDRLDIYTPVKGKLGVINDVDYFGATLEPGVLYKEVLTPQSGNPQLAPDASWRSTSPLTLSADKLTLSGVLPAGGTYVSAVYSPTGTATYQLSLQKVADDFASNATTTAKLAVGGTLKGSMDAAGDVDWIQVQVTAGQVYRFHVDGADTMRLLEPDSKGDTSIGALGADGTYAADTSGVRYLEVSSKTAGAYVATVSTVQDDYGNDTPSIPALAAGSTLSGTLEYGYDMDRVALHALAGHTYRFTYTLAGNGTARVDGDFKWWFGNDATRVITQDSTDNQAVVTFVAQATTDTQVGLTSADWKAPTGWTLRYEDLGADDFGPTADTAGRIAGSSVTTGRMDGTADIDAFRASVPWGVSYRVTLGGALAAEEPDATGGLQVLASPSGTGTGTGTLAIAAAPGKDLVFYVSDLQNRTGSYTVKLQPIADDYTANPQTAGRLAPGASASGTFEYGGDRDWFAVALKGGTTYVFNGDEAVSGLGVFDANGQQLSGPVGLSRLQPGGSTWLGFTPAHDGTYYLEVGSTAGWPGNAPPYSYTVSAAIGQNDDHPDASVVAAGTTIAGTIDSLGDTDTFLFDLKAGHKYTFTQLLKDAGAASFSTSSSITLKYTSTTGSNAGAEADLFLSPNQVYEPSADMRVRATVSPATDPRLASYQLVTTDQARDDYPAVPAAPNARPGATLHGSIETAGDKDGFRIAASAGKKLAIVVTGEAHDGQPALSLANLKVSLGSGVTMAGNPVYGVGGSEFLVVNPAASGDINVNIEARSGATGGYAVQVIDVSGDTTAPVLLSGKEPVLNGNDPLRMHFSEPVGQVADTQPASYKAATFMLTDLTAHVDLNYAADDKAHVHWEGSDIVITPDLPWVPGHQYILQTDNWHLTDLAGNAMDWIKPYFKVAAPATAGTSGDDRFVGAHDGKRIDGGAGRDTVTYTGTANDHVIHAKGDGTFTIAPASSATGAPATATTDTLAGIERVQFAGQKDIIALDIAGTGGQAYRLYQAAFARTPDKEGLGFWINAMDHGDKLLGVANGFIDSPEFKGLYGANTTDAQFVDLLYQNVLHRLPDDKGRAFWIDGMHGGATRADILVNFSESPENQANVATIIGNGFAYTPYGT